MKFHIHEQSKKNNIVSNYLERIEIRFQIFFEAKLSRFIGQTYWCNNLNRSFSNNGCSLKRLTTIDSSKFVQK